MACRRGGPGDDKCPVTPTSRTRESNCRALEGRMRVRGVVLSGKGLEHWSNHAHTRTHNRCCGCGKKKGRGSEMRDRRTVRFELEAVFRRAAAAGGP